MSKEKIAKAKAYILKQSKLKLKGLDKPTEKNPKDFLKAFFTNYNRKLETVYCSNGQHQCHPGKRRSITDIYLITSHYFPKASLSKMYVNLLSLIVKGVVVSSICRDIHKRVYRGVNQGEASFLNGTLMDEFDIDLKTFKDEEGNKLTTLCSHNKTGWGNNYTRNDLEIIQL